MDASKGFTAEIKKEVESPASPIVDTLVSDSSSSSSGKEEVMKLEVDIHEPGYSADDEQSFEGEDNNNAKMSPDSGESRMINLASLKSMVRRLRTEYDILDVQKLSTKVNRKRMIKIGKLLEEWEFKDSDYDSQHWAEIRSVHFTYWKKMKMAWKESSEKKRK